MTQPKTGFKSVDNLNTVSGPGRVMEDQLRRAVAKVLDMYEHAERRNFDESGKPREHIWRSFDVLKRWLKQQSTR